MFSLEYWDSLDGGWDLYLEGETISYLQTVAATIQGPWRIIQIIEESP